jgi:hypothetical protein
MHLVAAVGALLERLEQILQRARYDAPVVETALAARHSKRFPAPCLPVREYSAIEAIERAVYDWPCNRVEYRVLLRASVERLVERKFKMVARVVDNARRSFNWHVKCDFALFKRIPAAAS